MTVEDQRNRTDRAAQDADMVEDSTPEDPDLIRADISATRSALGSTVEELADRVNPVAQTKRAAERLRSAGGDVTEAATRWRVPLLAVAAVALGAVTWALIRSRRRC